MTLAELEALEERRTIAVRHARFNAALIASATINMHRAPDSEGVSPFDYLSGFETDPEVAEKAKLRKSVKHAIGIAFTAMKAATKEQVQAEKAGMIRRLRDNGIEDPEELIREVFPDL